MHPNFSGINTTRKTARVGQAGGTRGRA